MAEADTSLTQRVESLERTSQERVVEQVVDLGERVAGLESARDTEQPHLATKADIVRLETHIGHLQEQVGQLDEKIDKRYDQLDEKIDSKLDAQSEQFDSKLDAQSAQFDSKLEAQSAQLQKIFEQRLNRMTAWLIGTGLAIAALILIRLPG
ncbi:MAG: hypothetical protein OXG85_01805 [Chloroflexi bacterium]|nr:hypothetical protein [Chloroflexota bacterium]